MKKSEAREALLDLLDLHLRARQAQAFDYRGRRAGRCEHTIIDARLVRGQTGFGERGQLRQAAEPLGSGDQCLQLAALHMPEHGTRAVEKQRDAAAFEVAQISAVLFVGHVEQLDAGGHLEPFAGKMLEGADALRSEA